MLICSADMPRTCWTSIFSISGVSCPSNITRVKYTNRRKHRKVMLIQTNAFLTRKYRQLLFPNTNRRHLQVLGLPGYHQFLGPFVRATQVIVQGNESQKWELLGPVPRELTYQLPLESYFVYCSVN